MTEVDKKQLEFFMVTHVLHSRHIPRDQDVVSVAKSWRQRCFGWGFVEIPEMPVFMWGTCFGFHPWTQGDPQTSFHSGSGLRKQVTFRCLNVSLLG